MAMAIASVAQAVEAYLKHEGSGHDWQHIYRVWQTAKKLGVAERADMQVVELAALLHDVDDYKLTDDPTSEEKLPTARRMMAEAGIPASVAETVCTTIKSTGYSKSLAGGGVRSLEAHILSDADQLDALGAVGIGRTFAYCGHKGFGMFDPESVPMDKPTREAYVKGGAPSVTHFFEKLLKLRGMMFTEAGKAEAAKRHERMVVFLEAFFEEAAAPAVWKGRLEVYR